ncbi:hypothetical protein V6N12_030848 [Hibiscus sabdariffa]|uniref:DUF659 domain-containing protein n=1 Tax=Hibiscus sabdariffa TaxID=183260 RepID=A0ABR2E762_9ROSI
MESGSTGSSTPIDPTRKYGKPDPLNRNNFLCNFCSKITKGGEYLMKQHLVGGFKNVTKCPQCPEHIREEVKNFMLKKEEVKTTNLMSSQDFSYGADDQEEEDELEMFDSSGPNSSKRSRKLLPKKTRTKGPMDMFVAAKANPHKEGSVQVAFDKQLREKTCRAIAKFFYDVRIAFNAATYRSFKQMCEAIGQYGHGLKVPSMHELRVPLLKKDVDDTKIVMEGQQKGQLSEGYVFIKSVDVSEIVKDVDLLYRLLDDMVEQVGEQNVIQVVTDNASNYVKVGCLAYERLSPSPGASATGTFSASERLAPFTTKA